MNQNKKQNYQIISLIGKGAYGEVYKARKKFTGQFVAIKSIKKKGKEEKDIKVMRDQIEILKKLKHQNIILLLDSFETKTEFILVTELGQGELFNIIEDDQSIEESQIRKIAQQVVRALDYLHSNRITHRDMKPQNILMMSDGVIKLCDFGFARIMSKKTEVLTSLKGTPLYMAPEVVKEEPYTQTADLWSLGVILYELATGVTPFSAPNLISLVEHISKDPIVYPDYVSGDFKHFLKGLLNKDPKRRLTWPELSSHPFIKQTENERVERKRKVQKFENWMEENHCNSNIDDTLSRASNSVFGGRSISQTGLEDKSRDVSPKKQNINCNDAVWNKYIIVASDEKGANTLRSDPTFLDHLLKVLEMNINQIIHAKEKKNTLSIALKVLIQVMMKSRTPESKKSDNSKNLNIPNHLLATLKGFLKIDNGKQFIEIINDITKLIGLLAKATFHKNFGIEMVYVRSFVPLMPLLIKTSQIQTNSQYQNFVINLLRTTGIFVNNASMNHIRSFSFYKDIVEKRFIQECMGIAKAYYDHLNVLKILVQVFSAFMHPVYGDIQSFPWKKENLSDILEYKECATLLECIRQCIINTLLENNCSDLFLKILLLEDEEPSTNANLLPKISVMRIILQSIRQSKQFTQYVIFEDQNIVKHIFSMIYHQDQVVYATACQIISQLIKYSKEKKKEKHFEGYITTFLSTILERIRPISLKTNEKVEYLNVFGSLVFLQEIIMIDSKQLYFLKIIEHMESSKSFMKIVCEYISIPGVNKLQEMRKIEGSNYGLHVVGLYDPAFLFLHRLLMRLQKENNQNSKKLEDILKIIKQSKIQNKIIQLMVGLSSKTDLSPRGLISLLMLIYDLVSFQLSDEFADQKFLQMLIFLLKETQIQALHEWPVAFGGSEVCLTTMFGNLMKIFLIYLQEAEKEPEITRIMYDNKLLELLINFTKFLNEENINSVITFMNHLLAFDRSNEIKPSTSTIEPAIINNNNNNKNTNQNQSFVRQFIEANGMSLFVRFHLLKSEQYPANCIIETCNLMCQIAKTNKNCYEHIDAIEPFQHLKILIHHSDSQVRSRVLNLIGNMCRHSGYFYKKILETNLLKECIGMCEDEDKTIKKFACVVIGNASFHDDTLYEALKPAIPVLVSLLRDSEEKTRSNAAAALGNLARNSSILDKSFIDTGANYQLIYMLSNDKSTSARKVSIMAIINLLELPESKKVILQKDIAKLLQKMLLPPYNSDISLVKTAQKALQKLK